MYILFGKKNVMKSTSSIKFVERKLLAADLQNRDGVYFIHVKSKNG
jgi:hypothetical protein